MDQTFFIFINVIIVIALIVFFLKGKSSAKPSKLNLSSQKKLQSSYFPKDKENVRSLTIYFTDQGETKEAYEILELPAGAPLNMAESAYHKTVKANPDQKDLYLKAIQAIRQAHAKAN